MRWKRHNRRRGRGSSPALSGKFFMNRRRNRTFSSLHIGIKSKNRRRSRTILSMHLGRKPIHLKQKRATLSVLFDCLFEIIFLLSCFFSWLIEIIPRIVYFLWSIWGYRKSEYYQVTHKSPFNLMFNKGAYGEYLIYRHIDKNIAGNKKWLFNVYLPRDKERTTEIDVMLFHSSGIYIFESKNYKGWIFGSENHKIWTQSIKPSEKNKARKYRFLNPIIQNKLHLSCLEVLLTDEEKALPLHSVIIFGNNCRLQKIQIISGEHAVIQMKEAVSYVSNICNHASSTVAESWMPLYTRLYPMSQATDEVKQKHIDDINAEIQRVDVVDTLAREENYRLRSEMETIESTAYSMEEEATPVADNDGVCPRCGGKLVRRIARKGPNSGKAFIGCSDFPKCHFTKQI